jgi:hypothetical protein
MKTYNREFFIPESYKLLANSPALGFAAYGIAEPRAVALIFSGKSNKPRSHYRFASVEKRDAYINEQLSALEKSAADKLAKREIKKQLSAAHDVKPGDIFRASWGYDQTNIDFYQVLSVSGVMAKISQIKEISENDPRLFMQGVSVPMPGAFIGRVLNKKIQRYSEDSEPYFNINSFTSARRFKPAAVIDGKAIFEPSAWTAYA